MTRTHATARRPAPQPAFRTTLTTLVCIAAGVGTGMVVKQQQTALKEAKVLRLLTVAPAPASASEPVRPVPAPALVAAVASVASQPGMPPGVDVHDAAELRSRLRWVTTQVGPNKVETLDPDSRLLLARSAAQKAGLADVGLDYRDVYGVIHAESSWVARPGLGRNGVVSHGLAQFEPATARAVGLRNPGDPVEAVHASALLLKEAARWSAARIDGLKLDAGEWALKLREGVSVYYNLSSRGRRTWDGLNSHRMPVETRLHIRNVQMGALRASQLTARGAGDGGAATEVAAVAPLAAATPLRRGQAVVARAGAGSTPVRVASAGLARPARAAAWVRTSDSITLPEGTIRWSSRQTGAERG